MQKHINLSLSKVLEQLRLTNDVERKRVLLHKIATAQVASEKVAAILQVVNNKNDAYNEGLKELLYQEIILGFASHPQNRYLCIHTRNLAKSKAVQELAFGAPSYHFLRPNILVVELITLNIINTN